MAFTHCLEMRLSRVQFCELQRQANCAYLGFPHLLLVAASVAIHTAEKNQRQRHRGERVSHIFGGTRGVRFSPEGAS